MPKSICGELARVFVKSDGKSKYKGKYPTSYGELARVFVKSDGKSKYKGKYPTSYSPVETLSPK